MNQWYQPYVQRTEIIKVNGENGARTLQMAPNSSILVLDEHEPLVWLCVTDGAGYKTCTPYEIKPRETKAPVSLTELERRITEIEEMLTSGKSNSANDAR